MDVESCTYASSEEKANNLKEEWAQPAVVLAQKEAEIVEEPGLTPGMIAAIICGATTALTALVVVLTCCCKKRLNKPIHSIAPKITTQDLEAGDHLEKAEPHEWDQTM